VHNPVPDCRQRSGRRVAGEGGEQGRQRSLVIGQFALPFREQRALSDDELVKLTEGLVSLRIVARTEMSST
jgi:hypothetical protein